MRHHLRVAGLARHAHRLERLGERADLVHLDEDRVRHAEVDAAAQPLGVRDEEVVPDQLDALAEPVGQRLPPVPVLLGHAVLDRDDRVALGQLDPVVGELRRAQLAALVSQLVGAVAVELAGRGVERDRHLLAGAVAGGLDPGQQQLQRVGIRIEVGGEASLVPDRGTEPALEQGPLQPVEDLDAGAQRLGEGREPHRRDHELLEVHLVVGVGAAVQDVHQRHRQDVRGLPAQVAPERHALLRGGGLRGGERHAEDRVRAES